ncbi:MAG: ABC transporter substrate-binding protein [Chloroflexi bacterium]|nr:ABC transporter substrate-binding protein [Chloroflexota bacterium]
MKRGMTATISLFLILSFTPLACGGSPPPTGQPPTAATPTDSTAAGKPAWERDWEQTLTTARKEGSVTMYTTQGAEFRNALNEAMTKKYSIAVESLTGRSDEIGERILREQRTRLNNADVLIAISTTNFEMYQREGLLQPLEKTLILPEVLDLKAWYRGQFTWLDVGPGEKTTLAFRESVNPPILINTSLVKAGELKSWNDLLDRKWKGKILMTDPTVGGAGQKTMTTLAYGIMNWDFIKALLQQEPTVLRNDRLATEWIAQGKFPILIGPMKGMVFQFTQAGAPIEYFTPSEGTYTSLGAGTIALVKGNPHPNAAKILLNYLLTKEGQTITAETTGYQSLRLDVPSDKIDPDTVRQPGAKYFSPDTDKGFRENQDDLGRQVVKIFQDYMKK